MLILPLHLFAVSATTLHSWWRVLKGVDLPLHDASNKKQNNTAIRSLTEKTRERAEKSSGDWESCTHKYVLGGTYSGAIRAG